MSYHNLFGLIIRYSLILNIIFQGFLGGTSGKEFTCQELTIIYLTRHLLWKFRLFLAFHYYKKGSGKYSCRFFSHLINSFLNYWIKGIFILVINRLYFLEPFWLHSKIDQKVQRFSVYPLPPHMHSLPYYQHSPPEGTLVTSDEPILTYCSHHLCYV